jgi:hypothetical protein
MHRGDADVVGRQQGLYAVWRDHVVDLDVRIAEAGDSLREGRHIVVLGAVCFEPALRPHCGKRVYGHPA